MATTKKAAPKKAAPVKKIVKKSDSVHDYVHNLKDTLELAGKANKQHLTIAKNILMKKYGNGQFAIGMKHEDLDLFITDAYGL